jgi:hydroxyacylglutathione hydrolase
MKTWKTKSGHKIIQILSGRSNVFLLSNGEKNILIDTSPNYMWNLLEKRLRKLNVNNIDYLILTHTHTDHAENSHRIKEKYRSLVFVHKDEASFLTTGSNFIPKGTNLITHIIVNSLIKKLYSRFRYEPCQYDFLVDSVFDLNDLGFNACIMHTPGHTIGSMSIIVDNEVALVGDTMFGIFKWSVFPPYADDIEQMIDSWGRLLETGCSVFIPSHGSANSRALVQKDYNERSHRLAINHG